MAFTAGNIAVQNYSSDPTILQYEVGYANYEFLTTPVYINFTLLPCPLGFMLAATQLDSTTLYHGATWFYLTLLWLYFALRCSTTFYHASTTFYHCST